MRTYAAVLVMMLLQAVPAAAQTAAGDLLIVPGSGIGPAHLGMPLGAVLKIAGPPQPAFSRVPEPDAAPAVTRYRLYYWFTDQGSRTAWTGDGGRVAMLGVFSDPRFTTRDGLHVGSTQAEVERVLGAPSRVSRDARTGSVEIVYNALGIMFFSLGTPAQVTGIVVFEPGTQGGS